MAVRNTANIGYQKQKWDAACVLGHISVSDHRNVIIGLIFLKYISTAFDNKKLKNVLPKNYASPDFRGGISKAGGATVETVLYNKSENQDK